MAGRPNSFMPMYWADYWADAGHLGLAAQGAYLNLIGRYWYSGRPLPDDDTALWKLAGADSIGQWRSLRGVVAPFFTVADGAWQHKRIDHELSKAALVYERRRAASRKANAVRYGSESESDSDAKVNSESESDRPPQPQLQPQPQSIASAIDVSARAPRPPKGTRLPTDWRLPEDWHEWASHNWPHAGMDEIWNQADVFRDYWTAQPGQKGVKTDWPATWRNWIRRAAKGGTNGGSRHYRKSGFDVVLDEIRSGASRAMEVDPD